MKPPIMLLTSLLLVGCSKAVDLQDATVDQLVEASAAADLQRPGRWTVTSRVATMDLGTTDPAMAPMIREQAMQPRTSSMCIAKGQPSMISLDQAQALKTMSCHVPHFSARKGVIDGQIECRAPDGAMTMQETGTYSADAYRMQLSVKQTTQGQSTTTTTTDIDARRVGDCES